jgi:hypothetical protein
MSRRITILKPSRRYIPKRPKQFLKYHSKKNGDIYHRFLRDVVERIHKDIDKPIKNIPQPVEVNETGRVWRF